MDWTKEQPKESGYYWFYPEGAEYEELVEFHVNTWKDKPNAYWFLSFASTDVLYPDVYANALWAGPLHPPMLAARP